MELFLTQKLYLHLSELFEIELIGIKMDLALNNLQRLICHKTQPTNLVRMLYLSMGSSVETWKLECNIEFGRHTRENDKTNWRN